MGWKEGQPLVGLDAFCLNSSFSRRNWGRQIDLAAKVLAVLRQSWLTRCVGTTGGRVNTNARDCQGWRRWSADR
jgi:hypothetical protein